MWVAGADPSPAYRRDRSTRARRGARTAPRAEAASRVGPRGAKTSASSSVRGTARTATRASQLATWYALSGERLASTASSAPSAWWPQVGSPLAIASSPSPPLMFGGRGAVRPRGSSTHPHLLAPAQPRRCSDDGHGQRWCGPPRGRQGASCRRIWQGLALAARIEAAMCEMAETDPARADWASCARPPAAGMACSLPCSASSACAAFSSSASRRIPLALRVPAGHPGARGAGPGLRRDVPRGDLRVAAWPALRPGARTARRPRIPTRSRAHQPQAQASGLVTRVRGRRAGGAQRRLGVVAAQGRSSGLGQRRRGSSSCAQATARRCQRHLVAEAQVGGR